MKTTKKLLATAIAASAAVAATLPAHAEIELGEGLSVTGFVDMSFVHTDVDGVDSTTNEFGVDQVETDFLYSGKDGVSAQVDIEYSEDEDAGEVGAFVEQAFISKDIGGGLSVKAGRFLSYTGWETEEPTGLYQYSSTGYAGMFYGGYQQGVSTYYDTDAFDVMVTVANSIAGPKDTDTKNLAVELGVAVTPAEGVTAKLFYTSEEETSLINFWSSYEAGPMTFAFEYNIADYGDEHDASGFLLMGNYALTEKSAVTLRYHSFTEDMGDTTINEGSAITLAPSYAVSDNLLLVAEVRMDDTTEYDAFNEVDIEGEVTTIAFEALFTF